MEEGERRAGTVITVHGLSLQFRGGIATTGEEHRQAVDMLDVVNHLLEHTDFEARLVVIDVHKLDLTLRREYLDH